MEYTHAFEGISGGIDLLDIPAFLRDKELPIFYCNCGVEIDVRDVFSGKVRSRTKCQSCWQDQYAHPEDDTFI